MTAMMIVLRRIRVVLVTAAVVLGLAACDQEMTATINANGTVSGTWILAETNAKIQSEADLGDPESTDPDYDFDDSLADYHTMMGVAISTAFPTATITPWSDDDYSGLMGTFTDLSYDDFEAGVASALTTSADPATLADNVTLTRENDRYTFGVVNLVTDIKGNPSSHDFSGGGTAPEFNSLTLTFPVPVLSANGTINGRTVTWNFVKHPELTTLFADTGKATVKVVGPFKKSGKPKVGTVVKVKAPAARTAGAVRKFTWYAGPRVVKGATRSTLKLTNAHKGKVVRVTVTYTKPGYYPFARKISFGRVG